MRYYGYEPDDKTFSADAYTVAGYTGIAWAVLGWQTEPNADTEWTGQEDRTGKVVASMVGDDRQFLFDVNELTPISSYDYCGTCGQIRCSH